MGGSEKRFESSVLFMGEALPGVTSQSNSTLEVSEKCSCLRLTEILEEKCGSLHKHLLDKLEIPSTGRSFWCQSVRDHYRS